ncbi:MAG: hypothetical protein GXY64_10915 [Bacteroidales bacterium]|nr:hypothetical protein [Bacteroidales bacterium]
MKKNNKKLLTASFCGGVLLGILFCGCKSGTSTDVKSDDTDSIPSVKNASDEAGLSIPDFDLEELETLYADDDVEGGFILDNELDKTFVEYALVDIDNDGMAEVFLRGEDSNQGALFAFGSGKAELLVRQGYKSRPYLLCAEWADTQEKKYPGFISMSGGLGTGVGYTYYVKVEKSRPVVRFSELYEAALLSDEDEVTYTYAVNNDLVDEQSFGKYKKDYESLYEAVFGKDGSKNQGLEYLLHWSPVER